MRTIKEDSCSTINLFLANTKDLIILLLLLLLSLPLKYLHLGWVFTQRLTGESKLIQISYLISSSSYF